MANPYLRAHLFAPELTGRQVRLLRSWEDGLRTGQLGWTGWLALMVLAGVTLSYDGQYRRKELSSGA